MLKLVNNIEQNLYEKFVEHRKKNREIPLIIFGAGSEGAMYLKLLEDNKITVEAFCDNDPNKQNTFIRDKKIYSIKDMIEKYQRIDILINDSYHKEKKIQLDELNNKNNITTWRFDIYNPLFKGFYKEYIYDNLEKFKETYDILGDSKSKEVFEAVLNTVISGDLDYMEKVMTEDEYFPKDIIPENDRHVFLDVGAYDGDTIKKFIKRFGNKYKKIHAIEPIEISAKQIEKLKIENLELHKVGASSKAGNLEFFYNDYNESGMLSTINTVNAQKKVMRVPINSIDNILNGEEVTFIKMDIEGGELEALKGAEDTIKKFKPTLAICVYHKKEDLIEIPRYLKNIMPEYKFYLRQYSNLSVDTVLYCI